jgi:hypothetical protein
VCDVEVGIKQTVKMLPLLVVSRRMGPEDRGFKIWEFR